MIEKQRLMFRREGEQEIVAVDAGDSRKTCWRWKANQPISIVGVAQQTILIVRERLGISGNGVVDRVVGLNLQTGKPIWQTVCKGVSKEAQEIYARLLFLFEPGTDSQEGQEMAYDVQTGRQVFRELGDRIKQTPREILYACVPGTSKRRDLLSVFRIDPQTLRQQSLSFPLPPLPGVVYDPQPMDPENLRLEGDRIEALYKGVRGLKRETVYFIAHYRWSRGPHQKPVIQMLRQYQWPG